VGAWAEGSQPWAGGVREESDASYVLHQGTAMTHESRESRSTPDPEPQTLNPKPRTPNPKRQTLNAKAPTLNESIDGVRMWRKQVEQDKTDGQKENQNEKPKEDQNEKPGVLQTVERPIDSPPRGLVEAAAAGGGGKFSHGHSVTFKNSPIMLQGLRYLDDSLPDTPEVKLYPKPGP